jgi:hypothetical protein
MAGATTILVAPQPKLEAPIVHQAGTSQTSEILERGSARLQEERFGLCGRAARGSESELGSCVSPK